MQIVAHSLGGGSAWRNCQSARTLTLVLDHLDGKVFLSNPEKLKVAKGGLLGLGLTGVAVDLDTEVVALILPVEFALGSAGPAT